MRAGRTEMVLLLVLGMVFGLGTLTFTWAVTTPGGWLANTAAPAHLEVDDTEAGTVWRATFERGVVRDGKVRLQKRSIKTTLTQTVDGQVVPTEDGVEHPTWVTISIADVGEDGSATFEIPRPLGVRHEYRAMANPGPAEIATEVVVYSAPRPSLGNGLATVYVDTNEGAPVTDTQRSWEGQVTIVSGVACRGYGPALAKVSGRSSATWNLEKKSYDVTLARAVDLCGLGAASRWTLLANHVDRSLLRTSVAMYVAPQLEGLGFSPLVVPVDLVVNGQYRGSYSLSERVEIGPDRLAIDRLNDRNAEPQPNWDAPPTVTGGYLLVWDHRAEDEGTVRLARRGTIAIVDPEQGPKGQRLTSAQRAYISDYLNKVDEVLFGPGFSDPESGWRKYIDERSLVDYYILQEFLKSPGANLYDSVYMYKMRDTADAPGKLRFGPIADVESSMGAVRGGGGQELPTGWWLRTENPEIKAKQTPKTWFNRLNDDAAFRDAVAARWKEVAPVFAGLPSFVDAQAALISQSADANFRTYRIDEHLDDTAVVKGSWAAEVAYLKDWTTARTAWLNANLTPQPGLPRRR